MLFKRIPKNSIYWFYLIPLTLFARINSNAFAASIGTAALLRQIGRAAATASCDFISSSPGLDAPISLLNVYNWLGDPALAVK